MSFQKRLKEFFDKHDPARTYLVPKIAKSFRRNEDAVFKRLEEIYSSGGPSKLTYKELAPTPESEKVKIPVHNNNSNADSNSENTDDAVVKDSKPVKKKGKLKGNKAVGPLVKKPVKRNKPAKKPKANCLFLKYWI